MKKTALILDLDNTIYPVHSIGEKLFSGLFALIEESGEFKGTLNEVKREIQRTPFEKVAEAFSFNKNLLNESLEILTNLTYNEPMFYYEDYEAVRELPVRKFLVTSGFTKLQNSKIDNLKIRDDFEHIFIIDLQLSTLSKKDIFAKIMEENNLQKEEVLVVGDDFVSEIKAGNELGIDTVLYDRENTFAGQKRQQTIQRLTEIKGLL